VAKSLSDVDQRAINLRTLNDHFSLPRYTSLKQWEARAQELRTHILAVNGLLPMPPQAPLRAQVFDTTEHEDYAVSKVYFESHPGFLVTGNLFVPRGRRGPFPAVLNPHGHWPLGRFANEESGTVLGRGISFARQGYVAFCHDMVGYNDQFQVEHRKESDRQKLWGLGQMALQLFNSIRAVDFLQSLPEVDPDRIGCTGESGGGTQTFMLMSIDSRIKVAAPVVMVSAIMQGGCVCENHPTLRLFTSNPEIAALMAPRPLFLVSCTGDWTKNTLEEEYPYIKSIYKLYGAADRVSAVRINADHNYNLQSRNAVYPFFAKWLLGADNPDEFVEQPYSLDTKSTYLVFASRPKPKSSPVGEKLFDKLTRQRRQQITEMLPADRKGLKQFQQAVAPAMSHLLAAEVPSGKDVKAIRLGSRTVGGVSIQHLVLTRPAVGDRVPAYLLRPAKNPNPVATLVVSDQGKAAFFDPATPPSPLVEKLLSERRTLLVIDPWGIGESKIPPSRDERAQKINHFLTYNRSDDANRIQDILTALGHLKSLRGIKQVNLIGLGCAGNWALLARTQAGFVHTTILDMSKCRLTRDEDFVNHLMIPTIRGIGDLVTAVGLIAPAPLCLLKPAKSLLDAAQRIYDAAGKPKALCPHEDMPAVFRPR
jgi:dienelactone hydrolase